MKNLVRTCVGKKKKKKGTVQIAKVNVKVTERKVREDVMLRNRLIYQQYLNLRGPELKIDNAM